MKKLQEGVITLTRNQVCVYRLFDHRDNLPHYVGMSSRPGKRLISHVVEAFLYQGAKSEWIKSVVFAGHWPIFELYSVHPNRQDAAAQERVLINQGRREGWPLVNQHNGVYERSKAWSANQAQQMRERWAAGVYANMASKHSEIMRGLWAEGRYANRKLR